VDAEAEGFAQKQDDKTDNCPGHGPILAAVAAAIEPSVYGSGGCLATTI
jgi:hypothetical protein